MNPIPAAVTTPLAMNQATVVPVLCFVVVVRSLRVVRVVSSEHSFVNESVPRIEWPSCRNVALSGSASARERCKRVTGGASWATTFVVVAVHPLENASKSGATRPS